MESKFENRVWLSVEIDRLSYKLNEFNKILSYICIGIVVLAAVASFRDTNGASIGLLFVILPLLANIYVWQLIRNVCVAVSLLLSDTCTGKDEDDSQDE